MKACHRRKVESEDDPLAIAEVVTEVVAGAIRGSAADSTRFSATEAADAAEGSSGRASQCVSSRQRDIGCVFAKPHCDCAAVLCGIAISTIRGYDAR